MARGLLSRRQMLAGTVGLGAALAGAPRPGAQAPPAARVLVPRETFFGNPDVIGARLSPDGESVAYVAPVDGVRNLWVTPVRDLAAARPVTRVTGRPIGSFVQWAHDNRHLVFFEDHDGDENWRASSVDARDGAIVPLTPPRGVRAFVHQASPRAPTTMLFSHNARDRRFSDLYRVDVVTGRAELVFENTRFAALVTDRSLELRLGSQLLPDGRVELYARRDGAWAPFLTVPLGDVDGTRVVNFSRDGRTVYLLDSRGRDKAILAAIEMATRATRVLAELPDVDLKDVVFDELTGRPLAVGGMVERQRWHAVDPRFARELRLLRAGLPGDVYLAGFSADSRKALVYVERDDASPAYALYDRGARRVRPLFTVRRRLDGVPLRPLEPIVLTARDGLRIPGYLTLPEPGARGVPLVMSIHGGPYQRDRWGYDSTHQWLANRGYAVLSVNFRGSTGYGKAFVTAADREWGGKMHDDLVDALDWAVARGIADPRRVGCFGASYGGYAALTAATRTPERFACIVDVFGIANLLTFMAAIPPYWRPWFALWRNRVGDPDSPEGRAFLEARSPLTHIERAYRPILIVQGLEDVRVTRAESEQMVAALRRRDVPVTYVTFRDEGHGFLRPENQIAFRAVTEAFLARHLGGAAQPIDRERDFRGSSLAVEAGADLIPGLAG